MCRYNKTYCFPNVFLRFATRRQLVGSPPVASARKNMLTGAQDLLNKNPSLVALEKNRAHPPPRFRAPPGKARLDQDMAVHFSILTEQVG